MNISVFCVNYIIKVVLGMSERSNKQNMLSKRHRDQLNVTEVFYSSCKCNRVTHSIARFIDSNGGFFF